MVLCLITSDLWHQLAGSTLTGKQLHFVLSYLLKHLVKSMPDLHRWLSVLDISSTQIPYTFRSVKESIEVQQSALDITSGMSTVNRREWCLATYACQSTG